VLGLEPDSDQDYVNSSSIVESDQLQSEVAEVICQEFVEVSSLVHQPSQHFETLNDYCHDDQSNILNPKELII
jgi:hypothetical protein